MGNCKKMDGCGCGKNTFNNAFIILILYILLAIIIGGILFY